MKKFFAAFAGMLLILGSISTVYAEESVTNAGSCTFTGKKMDSSFDSNKVAASVSQMEPGDTVTFSVNIKNPSLFNVSDIASAKLYSSSIINTFILPSPYIYYIELLLNIY